MMALQTLLAWIFRACRSIRKGDALMTLADNTLIVHNVPVPKTTGTGFGDLSSLWRIDRPTIGALSYPRAMSPLGGNGGDTFGYAGFHRRRFANPAICCPPSFGDDAGGSTVYGGHDMAATPFNARSAQTFPLTRKEARHCARLWFAGTPSLTLAEWRDNRLHVHCDHLPEYTERAQVFREEFAAELAAIVAGAPAIETSARREYQKSLAELFLNPAGVAIRPARYQAVRPDGTWTDPSAAYAVIVDAKAHGRVRHE